MDLLLFGVTAASLVLAVSMTLVAWKLKRDARRRADARVAALEALAFGEAGADDEIAAIAPEEPVVAQRRAEIPDTDRLTHAPIARTPDQLLTPPAPVIPTGASWDAALGVRTGRTIIASDPQPADVEETMFRPTVSGSSRGRRALVVAVVAMVMAVGLGTAYVLHANPPWPSLTFSTAKAPPAPSEAAVPLELLSLRHAVAQPGQFTVTGLVQNPQQGRAVAGLVAVVYLFDSQGRYLASGKTPLEYSALRPGDEAPFAVTIPATSDDVSRYRVGFRLEDGAVVAHVDRRGQPPASTTGEAIDRDAPTAKPPSGPRRVEG